MIKVHWSELSDIQFEDLCKDVLRESGLQNADRMSGPGSGDMGRDIVAEERVTLKIGKTVTYKTLVQCKNYGKSKTTISPKIVEEYANRAETLGYDFLLIITSHDLSSQAKTIAEKISQNKSRKVKISFWTESDLVDKIIQYPKIYRKYFGDLIIEKGKTEIHCEVDPRGHMYVMAFLVYKEKRAAINFLVDTGASITTILDADAIKLGLDFTSLKKMPWSVRGIGGVIPEIYLLSDVEILLWGISDKEERMVGIHLKAIHVIKPTDNYRPTFSILGMDVLRELEISFDKGKLRLMKS